MLLQRVLKLLWSATADVWGLVHIRKQVWPIWGLSQSTVSSMMDSVLMLSAPLYCQCALDKLGQTNAPPLNLPTSHTHTHTHIHTFSPRHAALPVVTVLIMCVCLCVIPCCYFDGEFHWITSDGSTDALHHNIWLISQALHMTNKVFVTDQLHSPLCSPYFCMRTTNFGGREISGRDDSYIC